MAASITAYKSLLKKLLPKGRAWTAEEGSWLDKLLEALAVELTRIEDRARNLIEEADPRTTTELLEDWEEFVRIPDECQDKASTVPARRTDVVRKLTNRGGSSLGYFKQLATSAGYTVIVRNAHPFRMGRNRMGDFMNGDDWISWFVIEAPALDVNPFLMGSSVMGEPLRTFRNEILECIVRRAMHAHVDVFFDYDPRLLTEQDEILTTEDDEEIALG